MAQTKKKRRRKHRGTQTGALDTKRRRTRPKTRAEARSQARKKTKTRSSTVQKDAPPTWKGAAIRGAIASLVFMVLLILLFKRSLAQSLPIALFMLVFYIPAGYYMDLWIWRRKERAKIRSGRKD